MLFRAERQLLIWNVLLIFVRFGIIFVKAEHYSDCVLNDDYCDCSEDEKQSNACSMYKDGGRFQCADLRFYKQSIFLSKVGDGVCDCCDGSDESYTKAFITCPNICDETGPEMVSNAAALDVILLLGIKERAAIIQNSKQILYGLRSGMRRAHKLIPQEEKLAMNYRKELILEAKLEKFELQEIVEQSRVSFLYHFRDFDIDVLRRLLAAITLLTVEEGVEAILVECDNKYVLAGPDPNDSMAFELVSESAIEYQKCDANMVAADLGIDGTISTGIAANNDTKSIHQNIRRKIEEITVEKVQLMMEALSLQRLTIDTVLQVLQDAVVRLSDNNFTLIDCYQKLESLFPTGIILGNVPQSPVSLEKLGHTRLEAEILRDKISTSDSIISSLRKGAVEGEKLENFDFGPNDSLFSLRDKCFSHQQNQYTYNICVFKEARQESILIGSYEKFTIIPNEKFNLDRPDGIEVNYGHTKESMYLIYNNGEICHGTGRPRNITMKLECSSGEERLSDIQESEICSYSVTLLTPIGCI